MGRGLWLGRGRVVVLVCARCGWWCWCVPGAGGLWFDRRFLRLRTGLRRIRWVAQFRRGPDVALAAGGCVRRLKVKPMVKSRRLRRALCNGGRGGVRRSGGGSSVGRLRPGSLVAVVARREPSRPGGVQPHHCCCGPAPSGRTPPGRAGCASTADSDEGSGTTPPVGRIPAPSGSHGHRRVRVPKWTPSTPQGSGTKATTSSGHQQTARPRLTPRCSAPAGGAGPSLHHGFDFQTSHTAAGRQRNGRHLAELRHPANPS